MNIVNDNEMIIYVVICSGGSRLLCSSSSLYFRFHRNRVVISFWVQEESNTKTNHNNCVIDVLQQSNDEFYEYDLLDSVVSFGYFISFFFFLSTEISS